VVARTIVRPGNGVVAGAGKTSRKAQTHETETERGTGIAITTSRGGIYEKGIFDSAAFDLALDRRL
jgi:hypothetical protein